MTSQPFNLKFLFIIIIQIIQVAMRQVISVFHIIFIDHRTGPGFVWPMYNIIGILFTGFFGFYFLGMYQVVSIFFYSFLWRQLRACRLFGVIWDGLLFHDRAFV